VAGSEVRNVHSLGLYSVPAGMWKGKLVSGLGEWIQFNARIPIEEYEKLARHFNPVKFDAAEWVGSKGSWNGIHCYNGKAS